MKVEIYFSPVCPHCPPAKKLVAEVVSRYGADVEYEEVNTWTPEGMRRGMESRVMAVPTVMIDGEIRLVGFPFVENDLVENIEASIRRKD